MVKYNKINNKNNKNNIKCAVFRRKTLNISSSQKEKNHDNHNNDWVTKAKKKNHDNHSNDWVTKRTQYNRNDKHTYSL